MFYWLKEKSRHGMFLHRKCTFVCNVQHTEDGISMAKFKKISLLIYMAFLINCYELDSMMFHHCSCVHIWSNNWAWKVSFYYYHFLLLFVLFRWKHWCMSSYVLVLDPFPNCPRCYVRLKMIIAKVSNWPINFREEASNFRAISKKKDCVLLCKDSLHHLYSKNSRVYLFRVHKILQCCIS